MNDTSKQSASWVPLPVGIRAHLPTMSGNEARVYLALWSRFNTRTGQLNPSIEKVAADTGITHTGVKVAVRELRTKGLIASERTGKSNLWTMAALDVDGQIISPSPSNTDGLKSSLSDRPKTSPSDGLIISPQTITSETRTSEQEPEDTGAVAPGGVAASPAASRCAPGSAPAAHESGAAVEVTCPSTSANQKPTAESEWVEIDHSIHSGRWDDDDDGYPPPVMSAPGALIPQNAKPAIAADPVQAAPLQTPVSGPVTPPDSSGAETAPMPAPAGPQRTSKARKPKAAKLTDERKAAICASAKAMESYLLEGQLNWRRWMIADAADYAERAGVTNWNAQQFAGFWWWRVSQARESYGQPIVIPEFGRLMSEIGRALDRMTNAQLLRYLDVLVVNWNLVRFLVGGTVGFGLVLNETVFSHGLVRTAMDRLLNMRDSEKRFWLEKMAEEWNVKSAA